MKLIPFLLTLLIAVPCYAIDVTLQWEANTESDLAGYNLYYGGTAGGPYNAAVMDIQDPDATEYTAVGLADEGDYFFVLTAYDTGGEESGFSNEDSTVAYWERQTPGPPASPESCFLKAITP